MIDIDVSFFIQIVSILCLMFVLNHLLYKPIRSIIEERQRKFDELNNEILSFEDKAKKLIDNYNTKLQAARVDGIQKKDAYLKEARDKEKELIAQTNKETEQKKQRELQELNQTLSSTRESLKSQVEAFALEISQKILGRTL